MQETIYDVIIVGSGMSGLYTAVLLKKHNPRISILILEQNNKQHIGGRANTELFYGTPIVIGAGIGRFEKDKLLARLMRYFNIPVNTFDTDHAIMVSKYIDVLETLVTLKKAYKNDPNIKEHPKTFSAFAKGIIGPSVYNRFIHSTGFTDYEKEDAYETIFEYGMEDNLGSWKAFAVPWRKLVLAMAEYIGLHNFTFNAKVSGIRNHNGIIEVKTSNHKILSGKKVVLATTVKSLRELLPDPIYKQIEGQPFLRVYGKFDKASTSILNQIVKVMTYVDFPLQKIIPMDSERGVFMIAYNDNACAIELKSRIENTITNCRFYERLLEKTLRLPDKCIHLLGIRSFYWEYGTHYYKPLKSSISNREEFIRQAQHPCENIFVVGELVSRNQGWTEGALESVAAVIDFLY